MRHARQAYDGYADEPSMDAVQMGLHVFFGCYHNLFRLMTKCGVLENLLLKEHTHTFVNEGGCSVTH